MTDEKPISPAQARSDTGEAESEQRLEDERVIAAMHQYVAALEQGQNPDRAEFLARHTTITRELAECLDGLDFVHAVGPELNRGGAEASGKTGNSTEFRPEVPLGDYRIIREIGRGGMGVVYEAVQMSLGRRVALKILPFAAALDAKQLKRFQNEAMAAANLHHTNIVPVFGIGCERSVHFYAMQYIEGQTLAAFIEERRRCAGLDAELARAGEEVIMTESENIARSSSVPCHLPIIPGKIANSTEPAGALRTTERSAQKTAYFQMVANVGIQAAGALEHAHQLGVIHRDIKPANLLVENSPFASHSTLRLWIADFGLAHCQSQAGLTMTGDLVGTLRYMSPEQALAKRVIMDHRTDIYSLGATLYELLTLEPVFGGTDRQELLRRIAFEEPCSLRRLNPSIPRELDTIVLKALEKSPSERYATAQELADDLQRFLEDKPIRAAPPTLLFRARKWTRRHRGVVVATVVSTVLALAVGLGLTGWQWRRAEDRRERAEQAEKAAWSAEAAAKKAAAQVEAVHAFLTDELLYQASPFANPVGGHMTVRELLDKAAKRIDENKTVMAEPEIEATIRQEIGVVYYNLALFDKAEPHLRRALEIRQRVLGNRDPRTLATKNGLGFMLLLSGQGTKAEETLRENLSDLREVLGNESKETLKAMSLLGLALADQGNLDEAELLLRECYETTSRTQKSDARDTIVARFHYLNVVYESGRLDQAERLLQENLEAQRRTGRRDDDGGFVGYISWVPILLEARGRWGEAERKYREAVAIQRRVLGAEHYETFSTMVNLGILLHARGNLTEAEPCLRESVDLYRKVQPNHPFMIPATYDWGTLLLEKGEFKQAEVELRDALRIGRQAMIKDHYSTGQTLATLGWLLTKTGRAPEGESLLREGLDICRRKLPKKDWFTADTESLLGGCLLEQRHFTQAEPLLLHGYNGLLAAAGSPPVTDSWPIRSMGGLHDSPGAPPNRIRQALERIISLYEAWGKPEQAAQWRKKQIALGKKP